MVSNAADNLRERVPVDIVKSGRLEHTIQELLNVFSEGEEKNAELINKFFDQTYFRGEESLIDKLAGINPNLKFNDIEKESINLALLQYNNWMWDFNDCVGKIASNEVKDAFINEIHDKVQNAIGGGAPYGDFATECAVPTTGGKNIVLYFQKVVNYLVSKEGAGGSAKKTIDILQGIDITNKDLNDRLLAAGGGIPVGVNLNDPTVPNDIKNAFDTLLSFEIGKEADRTISIAKDISQKLQGLTTNTFPAINTIIGENDEYKFDGEKLLNNPEYVSKVQNINNDTRLNKKEKNAKIKALKWEYYLKNLKAKNAKIGNALEELYKNNFDYSKIDRAVLKEYLDIMVDIRLKMLFDNGINEILKINFGNLDYFKDYYRKLADPNETKIELSSTPPRNITVQKKIKEGPNEWLKDIDEFGKNSNKSYDALPIEYTIKRDEFETNVLKNVPMEDKEKLLSLLSKYQKFKKDENGNPVNDENGNPIWDEYEIKGEDIGILVYLFFIINSNFPIDTMDITKQQEVEDLFGKAKNSEGQTGKKSKDDGENDEDSGKESEEGDTPEKFKEEIEKLGPGKFENGSEIWLPISESDLPGGGHQRMKIKISDIDMGKGTFKGTAYGGELKFNSKLEGKSVDFNMNKKTIEDFHNISKDSNKIWLLPDPDNSDFNSFMKDKLSGKLGTNELTFPLAGATWTGDKFMKKFIDDDGKEKDVEIKYFGASSDDKSTYKVEYNPARKTFTVSSNYIGEEKGKDGESSNKRFSYKRDMDWNNFLIFFTQKGLCPQTEEESKNALARQENEFKMGNGSKRTLNRFSLNNLKNGFKDIISAINKKIEEYDKDQTEKFKGIIESPILDLIGSIPILPPSIRYAIGERQQEIYNEKLNGAWKEIEGYLKELQGDGQFADTFDQVPAHVQTLYGKSYKQFIIDLFNKKGNSSKKESRKAAALLLANYEKGGSPFRGLSEYENKGLWVKVLLGEDHYRQFLRDKAACIKDRDIAEMSGSEDDKKGLNEQLATCEMDYIINNVRGAYPKLPGSYFPSHETRGENGDQTTNYKPNPSKLLLSETFANKLEDAKKGRFTKDSVKETYSKFTSINRFSIMEDEFSKCGSSRYKQGAGALRRMFDLASNETLKKRAHKHFLTFLLSGILDVNCDPGLKKQIYGWAKPMSFVPGMLVKEAGVAENLAILLDDATGGDFSKNVTKYFHRYGQQNGGIDFKGLQGQINSWLTPDMMDRLENYFSELPTKDFSRYPKPQKKVLTKFKDALIKEDVEEFDRGLLDNPKIVNNGLLTNINVVSDRLRIEDGEFKGKDSDDINNKKEFWADIKSSINKLKNNNPNTKTVNFVLNKYFSRFGINSAQERQNVYKRINTAYYYKKQVENNGGIYNVGHKRKMKDKSGRFVEEKIPVGKIDKDDINKILLYGLEGTIRTRPPLSGKILPQELKEALDTFQEFFETAFRSNKLNHSDVKDDAFRMRIGNARESDKFLLGGWDIYKQIARKDDGTSILESDDVEYSGNFSGLKDSEQKRIWRSILRDDDTYINPHMENIEKILKRNRNILNNSWRLTTLSDAQTAEELQEKL